MNRQANPSPDDEANAAVGDLAFDSTLSIVIRFHQGGRTDLLTECLSSLAAQDWDDLELVLALQNATPTLEGQVARLVISQPWRRPPRVQIVPVQLAPGVDGRSTLLNRGVNGCRGRYVAFLDYDDVVCEQGYSSLIRQLRTHGKTWAVGGCLKTKSERAGGAWRVVEEEKIPIHRSVDRLWCGNFITIHSYVIDRARLGGFAITFDDNLTRLEDYDFLLRLAVQHAPDISLIGTMVCEYRIRLDGTNTTLDGQTCPSPEVQAEWNRCQTIVDRRKQELKCSCTVAELADMVQTRVDQQARIEQQSQTVSELSHRVSEQTRHISAQTHIVSELTHRMEEKQHVLEARDADIVLQRQEIDVTKSLLASQVLERSTRSYRVYLRIIQLTSRIPAPLRRVLFHVAFLAWQTGRSEEHTSELQSL
jgi:hypothetical protein